MKNKQQGYTLVELLVTLAASGLIFVAVGTVLFQLSTVSSQGNDRFTAIHELQNAGYWFNLDGQSAVTAAGSTSLVFSFSDGSSISYALTGTSLQRSEGASTITLAQNITGLAFMVQGRLVSMDITSTVTGRTDVSERNVYSVYLRPVQQ